MVETLPAVLDLVRSRTGVDFTRYRVATMQRRVQNHMVSTGLSAPREYLALLQQSPEAADALLERLTIKVSAFYRNPVTFDAMRESVLPELAAARGDMPLRVWSAGCSRGEEAYTLAMLLDDAGINGHILATDIDATALRSAQQGMYDPVSLATLPADLAMRYFEPAVLNARPAMRVLDSIRARVEFIRHDVTSHAAPPPGQFDLLCCRNVLIYLQRDLHQMVLQKLRHAVVDGGYLCLGEAEWPSPDIMASLSPLPRKTRLFRALAVEPRSPIPS